MELSFKDYYIGYLGHPKFQINKIIEDDTIRVIIQKYEMILFTNKGELLGDPDFGCDLPRLLFQTRVSASNVKLIIKSQIEKYIPEISGISYFLDVTFSEDPENYQEVMIIDFRISDHEVNAIIN